MGMDGKFMLITLEERKRSMQYAPCKSHATVHCANTQFASPFPPDDNSDVYPYALFAESPRGKNGKPAYMLAMTREKSKSCATT